MKHCPAEFKAEAVALYRSRPGAVIKSVATNFGVNTETLRLPRFRVARMSIVRQHGDLVLDPYALGVRTDDAG